MKNTFNILFLNCKSLNCKLGEIKLLLYLEKPAVFCFNETWMKKEYEPRFIGYSTIWKNRDDGYGGVGILINNEYSYKEINLVAFDGGVLEVQAINVMLESSEMISIFNCYNPNEHVTIHEVRHYIQQLSRKFIIVGDLNCQTQVLDTKCTRSNFTGRMLETLLTEDPICLINPRDMYTYVSFSNLKKSCLDVCLSSPNIASLTTIECKQDVGSDHYPLKVVVNISPAIQEIRIQKRWILENVKWNQWREDFPHLRGVLPNSVNNLSEELTNRILYTSHKNIKETSGIFNPSKRSSWWSSDISRKVAERRRAKRKLELHPLIVNLQDYKHKCNVARTAIKEAKKASWEKYISDIKSDTPIKEVWSKIRGIKNKQRLTTIPVMQNGNIIISSKDRAECLAEHFKRNNNENLLHEEELYKHYIRECSLKMDESDRNISMVELNNCLKNCKVTSPGYDKVSSKFLQELPESVKEEVLYLFTSYVIVQHLYQIPGS